MTNPLHFPRSPTPNRTEFFHSVCGGGNIPLEIEMDIGQALI
jgi:hypothetical protein